MVGTVKVSGSGRPGSQESSHARRIGAAFDLQRDAR
jgi:hypothetical protein